MPLKRLCVTNFTSSHLCTLMYSRLHSIGGNRDICDLQAHNLLLCVLRDAENTPATPRSIGPCGGASAEPCGGGPCAPLKRETT